MHAATSAFSFSEQTAGELNNRDDKRNEADKESSEHPRVTINLGCRYIPRPKALAISGGLGARAGEEEVSAKRSFLAYLVEYTGGVLSGTQVITHDLGLLEHFDIVVRVHKLACL